MYKKILPLILIVFSAVRVAGQQSLSVPANTSSPNISAAKFYYADKNEPPRAVEFNEKTVAASTFIANINRYFNIPAEFTFIEEESTTDKLGMRHRLVQQYYKGIQVEGMGYRVHERDGFVTSANGKAVRSINLETQTTISEQQAFQLAKQYSNSKDTVTREGKKLIISKNFTFTPESFSTGFQFDIDVSLLERWRISIDARSGQLINKVSLVNSCRKEKAHPLPYGTGTGLTNYYGRQNIQVNKSGSGSFLLGQTAHGGSIGTYDFRNVSVLSLLLFFQYSKAYVFYSEDNTYNSPYLRPAVSAQWAAEQAYEYYFKKHNRNSFDNAGGIIKSYMHVDQDLDNAFWNGYVLAFGDGSNNNPFVELDVVSHELTHGVTQYEAQLQYYNESGALNESFSDIMGKAVEFYTFGDSATWQIAKHHENGGIRNMSNPNLKNQPDTYAGNLWYTGADDSGGVHYNSGVQNFWFYLLCKGGDGVNDKQVNYSVTSIGMDAAVDITYRNLTEYLTPYSDYLDSRIGSLLAAADLYGRSSEVYRQVGNAWDAVGVVAQPIITSVEPYDITATTVKIRGTLLPRGDTVTYHFEYGTTPALGSSSPIYKYTNKVEGIITGLQSKTKYYFRLVATNENGNSYYASEFTTLSLAPLVKIKQTVDVTETTATLYGQVNPNSLFTSFYFEYGPTQALGLATQTYPLNDGTEFQNVSAGVINLQPRQTYYYRLVATNNFASSTTTSERFFTGVKPIINSYSPITGPIGTVVTIIGQNFNAMAEKNIITFGAAQGTVLSSSTTEIKVKVPAGASFGPLSVFDVESGLTAESVQEFIPTFTGAFGKNDLQLSVGISDLYIYQMYVQDMDGDNKPDIVCSHYQGFSVYQNVNQGGDITSESFIRNTYTIPDFSTSEMFIADLDGNGLKDVIGRSQTGLRVYPNLSVPGYMFFGPPVDLPTGSLGHLVFNDFDLDGHVDIGGALYLTSDSSSLVIFRNQNPKGSLLTENFKKTYASKLPYYVYFLTAGDLNNDGAPDLMVSPIDKNIIAVLENESYPGVFRFKEDTKPDVARARFARYVSHDINQDGWKDIIGHTPYVIGNTTVMENKGTSPNVTLEAPAVLLGDYMESMVKPGDMNGDGKVDLMVATADRTFFLLQNKTMAHERLTNSSFEKFNRYGIPAVINGSGTVDTQMAINDLNGDGRPDVVNAYSYNYGPHDGYQMEIWQNVPNSCIDPALVKVDISNNYNATIVLPPNTTFDQFEMAYTLAGYTSWNQLYSTTWYVSSGYSYQLRVRAKCYLGFTDYYYINFTTDCINTSYFSISTIGADNVVFNSYNYSYEVQYSPAGKGQWLTLPQNSNRIDNLAPGTTYDLRMRGICNTPPSFKYSQFTTLCPKLTTLAVKNVSYNTATLQWTSSFTGNVVLEYSLDNVNWTSTDQTGTMSSLTPGVKYFARGRFACTTINSDFLYTFFTTPCPKVSTVGIDNLTPFSATIRWVDDSETNNYVLTYYATAGGPVTTIQTNSTSQHVDGLSPGTHYTVNVAPQCISTKNVSSTTFITVCYALFDLSVDAVTHTTAELSWRDNFSGIPYSIDYSISGSGTWLTSNTALTKISLTELRPGVKYEARVHINCLSGRAPYVSANFETELYEETTFAPNPTDNEITIYPSKNLIGNPFSIYNSTGVKVADGKLLDYTINLSTLATGIYMLKIEGEKTFKIMKH